MSADISKLFSVSIKGILHYNGKYLLRKNERNEFELLGGRLEKNDRSPEERVITEFIEESGVKVEVVESREPWLYEIGYGNILIIPYMCKALSIPDELYDEDGGKVLWVDESDIDKVFMPQGYKDSIWGNVPHKSYSIPAKKYFKIMPNFVDRSYSIKVVVEGNKNILAEGELSHHDAPRDFAFKILGESYQNNELVYKKVLADPVNSSITLIYEVKR